MARLLFANADGITAFRASLRQDGMLIAQEAGGLRTPAIDANVERHGGSCNIGCIRDSARMDEEEPQCPSSRNGCNFSPSRAGIWSARDSSMSSCWASLLWTKSPASFFRSQLRACPFA